MDELESAAAKPAAGEIIVPGDDVRPRHGAKFFRPHDAGEICYQD